MDCNYHTFPLTTVVQWILQYNTHKQQNMRFIWMSDSFPIELNRFIGGQLVIGLTWAVRTVHRTLYPTHNHSLRSRPNHKICSIHNKSDESRLWEKRWVSLAAAQHKVGRLKYHFNFLIILNSIESINQGPFKEWKYYGWKKLESFIRSLLHHHPIRSKD